MSALILFAMNWNKIKCGLGFHKRVETATKRSYLFHESLNPAFVKSYTCLKCGHTKEVKVQLELL